MRHLLFAVLFSFALPAFAGNELGNKDVIEMAHLGLDQQVILTKISSSSNHFDTSPKALAQLKHAGVSSTIISAMISGTSSSTETSSAARPSSSEATVKFVDADGRQVTIDAVRVTAEASYRKAWIPFHVGGPETFMFLQGRNAPLRTGATPSFITNMDPLNVRLVHLGQNKDREARYVVFSGSTTDREIQLTSKKLGNGSYRVEPSKPLQPGDEYAFLVASELPAGYGFWTYFAQNAAATRAYDFGVK